MDILTNLITQYAAPFLAGFISFVTGLAIDLVWRWRDRAAIKRVLAELL